MRWNPDPVARWSLTPLIGFFLLFALALSPVAAQQNEPAGAVSTDDRATTSRSVVLAGQLLQNTLYDALVAEKIPPAEIINLAKAFKPVFDFRFARPGHRYELQLNGNRQIQTFVYKAGVVEEYEAVKTDSGGYRVVKRSVELDRQVAAKVFTIKTSLCQAIEEKGERQTLAGLIAELFAWDIDFYLYPRKGDRIAVVFERCYKDGRFVRYGKILAARYVGSQSTFSAFFFSDGTLKGYYDEKGEPLKKMFLRTPVKFAKMTSRYTVRRFHPVSKRYKAHTGIDYGAPVGTTIFATANGKVVFAGRKGGYGKLIILQHPNGYQTYYGHCSRLLKKRGDLVEQGQVIARVGRTGVATGPHVHYEVRVRGKPINPNNVKKKRGKPLPSGLQADFRHLVSRRKRLLNNVLEETSDAVMLAEETVDSRSGLAWKGVGAGEARGVSSRYAAE